MHMSPLGKAVRSYAFIGANPGRAAKLALVFALFSLAGAGVALPVLLFDRDAVPVSAATAVNAAPTSNGSWTVYHGDSLGRGVDKSGSSFSSVERAWTSPELHGQLYGEPLELDGTVYVATEHDTVYALSAASGQVVWSTHIGQPVSSNSLPCGDISPKVGITGTPVIDAARHEIFAVADETVDGVPSHHLVGLNTGTGTVELNQNVDPPGANTTAILQRTGLNLSDGSVVFGYGGNDGDCSTYHGWVVSVPETGGTATFFDVTSGADQGKGAVWMGGAAPVVDHSGNVWVSTGNGDAVPGDSYDGSDSVIELSPHLSRTQLFAPSNWATQNSRDQDLGSSPPALLSDGFALEAGKAQTAYEFEESGLGRCWRPGRIGLRLSWLGRGRRRSHQGHCGLHPLPERHGSGERELEPTRPQRALEQQQRNRPADPRRGSALGHGRTGGRHALRGRPVDRSNGAATHGPGQPEPLPDAVGRRWPAPRPYGDAGGRVHGVSTIAALRLKFLLAWLRTSEPVAPHCAQLDPNQ